MPKKRKTIYLEGDALATYEAEPRGKQSEFISGLLLREHAERESGAAAKPAESVRFIAQGDPEAPVEPLLQSVNAELILLAPSFRTITGESAKVWGELVKRSIRMTIVLLHPALAAEDDTLSALQRELGGPVQAANLMEQVRVAATFFLELQRTAKDEGRTTVEVLGCSEVPRCGVIMLDPYQPARKRMRVTFYPLLTVDYVHYSFMDIDPRSGDHGAVAAWDCFSHYYDRLRDRAVNVRPPSNSGLWEI